MSTHEEQMRAYLVLAKSLDIPIQSLREAQEHLVSGNPEEAGRKLAEAVAVINRLMEFSEPTPSDKGFRDGERAVEQAKGVAAGIWKGIFGEDPRQK